MLRTCECLGIQNVWLIGPTTEASVPEASIPNSPAGSRSPSRASGESPVRDPACWLSLRRFQSGSECVSALREDQREIWATDLSQTAERLDLVLQQCGVSGRESGGTVNGGSNEISSQMPARLAVVLGGSEAEGVSRELLVAAHRRVYLPLHGRKLPVLAFRQLPVGNCKFSHLHSSSLSGEQDVCGFNETRDKMRLKVW